MATPTIKLPTGQKAVVSFHADEKDGVITITRTEGVHTHSVATLEKGVLEYVDTEARKYHAAVVQFLSDEELKFTTVAIKGKERDEENPNTPKAPRQTIEQGDKTPAYVEWMKKYKPKEYASRYGVHGPGKISRVISGTDPVTGRPTKTVEVVEAVISDRKTHLTEKPDNAVIDDETDTDNDAL